ncbi:hypothetical protein SUGI_0776010 [Cryptomeria japonica]|nr:hypothetical protein SUGI_0776010 [Cryptomeria japonica]
MDTDDIIVALKQASDLHAKISDASERLLRCGREISTGGTATVINGVNENCIDEDINHLSPEEAVAMEARSLASIGDSMDVLQGQLYRLQVLQDRHQADIEAALSDIEETRKIFLQRLRKYQGREWPVIEEALAFLGEPVEEEEEKGDVLTNFYSCDKSLTRIEDKKGELFSEIQGHKKEASVKKNLLKSLCNNLSKSVGSAISLTAKTALVAGGFVILLAVSKMGDNKPRNRYTGKVIAAPSWPENDQKSPFMDESIQPTYEGVLIKSSVSPS